MAHPSKKEHARQWRFTHPGYAARLMRKLRAKRIQQGLCATCGVEPLVSPRQDCLSCLDASKERTSSWRRDLRAKVLAAYRDRCACCGETEEQFLNLDHVDSAPRKNGVREVGYATYQRAVAEDFPPTLQLLCYNCNLGREKNEDRQCPHLKQKRSWYVVKSRGGTP